MSITAKELAKKLGISEATVSMALNDKRGVGAKRKKEILAAAEQYGYDFTRVREKHAVAGAFYFIIYQKHGAVVADTPFFNELSEGIQRYCREEGIRLHTSYFYDDETRTEQIEHLRYSDCSGMILLGTEMHPQDFTPFRSLPFPIVLLDVAIENADCDCVLIDNVQGAYLATNYLISKVHSQPGYLRSAYEISNFEERADGFYKAVRFNGLSASKSIVHRLTPSVEGAYADMKQILREKQDLARCYFADNDLIAIGAIRAFQEAGYRIPKDIAVIGFDNMSVGMYISPALTTVNVPKEYMAQTAVKRLRELLTTKHFVPTKTLISVSLVKRDSIL